MLTYLILTGIVVSGFAFAMWLGAFLLNRGINTNLETAREGRRSIAGQLGYGLLLLGLFIVLAIAFFQMDREPVIPPVPTGLISATAPDTAQPEAGSGMGVTLVFGGIFLSGAAFVLWLGLFMLNRSTSTALRTAREDRRSESGQLAVGALLLSITVVLTIVLSQMDRTSLVPVVPKMVEATPAPAEAPREPNAAEEATEEEHTPESVPETPAPDAATPEVGEDAPPEAVSV